jgi:3-oxoacyl-[acyl-carrier protein] reductase
MAKLEGQVAIVTGAARGIGRGYAKRLAMLGAKVAVFDKDLRSFEEFEAEAKSMTADGTIAEIELAGGHAIGVQVDVTDPQAVQTAVARVITAWGRIDILVANAGGGSGSPAATRASVLDPALLQSVTAANLFSTIHTVAAVAPIMKQQRSGKIVTVSSSGALIVSATGAHAHYAAAKAAIVQYTRYLAQDLGSFGITANCIAPGVTVTGRIAATVLGGDTHAPPILNNIALRRLGTVEDCANVLEFLATDLSDYVTGILIPVDGGLLAG